ncbi:MAG: hypothetical protein KGP29_07115 [Proteobacteria bacterium]|nr:hypothetical protein [Pseudomonadota bacterium]
MIPRKDVAKCKRIATKIHKRVSWLNAFADAYGELEMEEKVLRRLSSHALAAKMALASQILIMSLAISGSSIARKDDCDFSALQRLLKNKKISDYFCQSVTNKDFAKEVLRDFKKFKIPKTLKTLRDKHFAHITSKRFLKGRGKMIYQYQQKVSHHAEMLYRLMIKKS